MITAIIILFLLQFITLTALVILYLRLQKNEQLYKEQSELVEQFELSMQVYLEEIRKDNELLLKRLSERSQTDGEMNEERTTETHPFVIPPIKDEFVATSPTYASHLQARLIQEQRKKMETLKEDVRPSSSNGEQQEQTVPSEQDGQNEEETYEAQVKRLYEEGESVETLAKRFNCGKTEIELLLKFHS